MNALPQVIYDLELYERIRAVAGKPSIPCAN